MNDAPRAEGPTGLLGWIIVHPRTVVVLGLLLIILLGVLLMNGQAERRLQSRIAAIRARGEPTTVGDLQAAMPVIPPEENMAVLLIKPTQKILAFKIPEGQGDLLPLVGTARIGPTGRRLPPEQLAAVREYLSQFPEELGSIHDAMKLEHGCAEIAWKTPLIDVLLPELSVYRHAAKTLSLEGIVAAEDADEPQAAQRLLDISRVSSVLQCEPFLISILVRTSIDATAEDQIERTINLCSLSDKSLQQLQDELARAEDRGEFKKAMMCERLFFIDMTRSVRSGNATLGRLAGGSDDPLTASWRYVPILPALDAAVGIDIYDAMVDAIDKPDSASIQRLAATASRRSTIRSYCLLSKMLVPELSRAAQLWVRAAGLRRAMQAALACERYRLARGEWPESLESLVPEYLAAVPIDPFDGKPIRYQRIPEGIKIWSIGEDMIDSGGDVMRLEARKNKNPSDWGWVLLKPDLRGKPAEPEATTEPATQ